MRVMVLGGGVIGTASAYYLARAGFDVVVVDRQPAVAMETSFANAGQVSPGYASPWAAPGVPLKAIKWLLERHAPLAIKATTSIDQYLWMAQMLRNCTASRYAVNKERLVRLSEYSRDCLDELRAETGIAYEARNLGTTQLFRTQAQLDGAAKDIAVLKESGVPFELLDRAGIARVEPHWPASPISWPAPCACRMIRLVTVRCLPPAWLKWPRTWVWNSVSVRISSVWTTQATESMA